MWIMDFTCRVFAPVAGLKPSVPQAPANAQRCFRFESRCSHQAGNLREVGLNEVLAPCSTVSLAGKRLAKVIQPVALFNRHESLSWFV